MDGAAEGRPILSGSSVGDGPGRALGAGWPQTAHGAPGSSVSNGRNRIVAFVSALTFASHSGEPHQPPVTKPPASRSAADSSS